MVGYFINISVFSLMLLGPFMPGITVDDFGRMVVDMDKTRVAVQKVIPPTTAESTARGNTVLSQIDQIAKAINEYNAGFTTNGKEIVNLYLAYDSKPEDFKRVFAQMDAEKENGQKKVLDARFKMKEVMTPQEWKALFNQKG
jgi:hypothetical protein